MAMGIQAGQWDSPEDWKDSSGGCCGEDYREFAQTVIDLYNGRKP